MFCSPHPPNCVVDKPIRHYIDHEDKLVNAVSVIVSLQDRHGNVVVEQCEHLEATSPQVTRVIVKEQDEGRGVYKITYQPVSIEADDVMIKWNGHDIIQCNVPGLLRDYTAFRVIRRVEESCIDKTSKVEKADNGVIDSGDDEENDPFPMEKAFVEDESGSEQVGDQFDNEENEIEEDEQEGNATSKNSIALEDKEESDHIKMKTLTTYGPNAWSRIWHSVQFM